MKHVQHLSNAHLSHPFAHPSLENEWCIIALNICACNYVKNYCFLELSTKELYRNTFFHTQVKTFLQNIKTTPPSWHILFQWSFECLLILLGIDFAIFDYMWESLITFSLSCDH